MIIEDIKVELEGLVSGVIKFTPVINTDNSARTQKAHRIKLLRAMMYEETTGLFHPDSVQDVFWDWKGERKKRSTKIDGRL